MMREFSGPLIIEEIGIEEWVVKKEFSFGEYTIPEGMITDLASSPKIARSLIPVIGYWNQGAVLHDMFYKRHRNGLDVTLSRLQADNLLLEGMRAKARLYDVPDNERRDALIYGAVRMWGWLSWRNTEEESTEFLLPDYYDQ